MYKVCLIYDTPGWSYQRRTDALLKYAPDDFCVYAVGRDQLRQEAPEPVDLFLQLNYGACQRFRRMLTECHSRAIMVVGYNGGWGYRPELLPILQEHADHVIFNNYENWDRSGRPAGSSCIMNGVDLSVFSVIVPPEQRVPRVLWTGSEYHENNNDVKGYRSIIQPLREHLVRAGLTFDFRLVDSHGGATRWPPDMMNKWYNSGMIYINASQVEGAVNPPLEAAAAGCVVVSTSVGNMPHLLEYGDNGRLAPYAVDAFLSAICDCRDHYIAMHAAMQRRIAGWDWRLRADSYYILFRRLIDARRQNNQG